MRLKMGVFATLAVLAADALPLLEEAAANELSGDDTPCKPISGFVVELF